MSMRPRQAGRKPGVQYLASPACIHERSTYVPFLYGGCYFTYPSNQQLSPSFSPSLFPRLLSVETSRETELPGQRQPPRQDSGHSATLYNPGNSSDHGRQSKVGVASRGVSCKLTPSRGAGLVSARRHNAGPEPRVSAA